MKKVTKPGAKAGKPCNFLETPRSVLLEMTKLFIWLLIGGGIGAAMGYLGQCTSGACPLTANWKRGAMVGAVLGMVLFFGSGCTASTRHVESSVNVQTIQESDFEEQVLKSAMPVVVDFYAPWCGPCHRLAPMLDRVAGQFTAELRVVKINVDHAPKLAEKYKVKALPTLKFFVDGREVGGMVGLPSESKLEADLRGLANSRQQAAGS
jgi:thioredoxin 1